MITQLYTFSTGSYVVAEEWNANFRVLHNASLSHKEAVMDGQNSIAFPTSDLSNVFASVKSQPNSSFISGSTVVVAPEQEYYKTLSSGQDLTINIPDDLNSEVRILIQTEEDRTLLPFIVNYSGTKVIDYGFYNYDYFRAGYYYIMIYETNGLAQIKLIWTGA